MNKIGDTIISRNGQPLKRADIINAVPAIMTEVPHESRSDQYQYISTKDVLNALWKEGFGVYSAQQQKSRRQGHAQHAKHLVRLRHRDQLTQSGEGVNEIILINSHDGSSSYNLMAGYFRFVCSNGLIVGDTVAQHHVTHRGEVGDIIEAASRVLEDSEEVNEQREEMRSIILRPEHQQVLAQAALEIRYPDGSPISTTQALSARRFEDRKDDIWTVYNRLQENLVKGGQRGRNANGRRQTTRQINGIDGLVGVNRGLWTLAQGMVELAR